MNSFWKGKNVCITGINGFVASAIASSLVKDGANVVGTLRDTSYFDKKSYFFSKEDPGKIKFAMGDIQDLDFMSRLLSGNEIEYVFHLAACSTVRIASRNPMECFNTNIKGTYTVCEAIRNCPTIKGAVVASSDKAYGVSEILPYTEDMNLNGLFTYDASKTCTDIVSRSYASNYDCPITVLRCSNIYGPGDFNLTRIIPNTVRRLEQGSAPILWDETAKQEREFTYIDDIVIAYKTVLEDIEKTKGQAFNFGTGIPTNIASFMDKILESYEAVTKKLPPAAIIKQKEGSFKEIPCQYLDSTKIERVTGRKFAKTSLDHGLLQTVKWYVKYLDKM